MLGEQLTGVRTVEQVAARVAPVGTGKIVYEDEHRGLRHRHPLVGQAELESLRVGPRVDRDSSRWVEGGAEEVHRLSLDDGQLAPGQCGAPANRGGSLLLLLLRCIIVLRQLTWFAVCLSVVGANGSSCQSLAPEGRHATRQLEGTAIASGGWLAGRECTTSVSGSHNS